jgi:phosphatidylethanolamine-binding protein (PEBP) family uncharacterized protein
MHNRILAAIVVAFGALSASTAFAQNMKLTSTEVADGSTIKEPQVANVFGCKGGNASPSLSWSGAPSDTDGYGGPCPPQGDKPHHYIFTVYAVDEDKLQYAKDHNVSAAVVGFELHFHSKDKASLTATYGR